MLHSLLLVLILLFFIISLSNAFDEQLTSMSLEEAKKYMDGTIELEEGDRLPSFSIEVARNLSNSITFDIWLSSWEGDLELMKKLLNQFESELAEAGEEVRLNLDILYDEDRNAPIHLAAFKGHLDILKFLIEERYSDINLINNVSHLKITVQQILSLYS